MKLNKGTCFILVSFNYIEIEENNMSKTDGLVKKKNLLRTLLSNYFPLQLLLFVLAYLLVGFINIPINKWLSFNWQIWSSGKYHPLYGAFFVLPCIELISCIILCAVIGCVYYFFSGIIAYRNYCYIPLTEDEIKNKGFKNADEYFEYVWNICSYGFKGNRSHIFVDDSDLQKMLISCMKVFSDNGTIFGVVHDMAIDITENSSFLSALELASDKKAEIRDDHVVLSGKTKDGNKKGYTI